MFFEQKEGIYTLAQDELQHYVNQLLNTTANHYQVMEGVVKAFAGTMPDMALKLTQMLNTEDRRDAALLDLLKEIVPTSRGKFNLAFIQRAIDNLSDPDLKDDVVFNVIAYLSKSNENLEAFVVDALPIINRIKDINDAGQRCLSCCFAYTFLEKLNTDRYSSLSNDLLNKIESAWADIDIEWHRINIGFRIVKNLSTSSVDEAKKYLLLTEQFRDEVMLDDATVALAYMYCIRLAIRVYSGLLPKNLATEEDLRHLARLIDDIVSYGERAKLWAELALRCYINKSFDIGNDVVKDRIKPLLLRIPEKDKFFGNIISPRNWADQ